MARKEKNPTLTKEIGKLLDSRVEWEREAQFDRSGRVRRYLDLAERMLASEEGDHCDTACCDFA